MAVERDESEWDESVRHDPPGSAPLAPRLDPELLHTEQPRNGNPAQPGFRPRSLDALNFFLADVRGGLGPYLNVFLVTQQGWSQSSVGLMTTIGGLVALGMQPAAGAVIDATHAKRGALILALSAMALGALVIFSLPTFCFRSRSTSSRSTGISLSFAVLHVINVGSASAIHPKQRGRHLAGIAPRSHRRYG